MGGLLCPFQKILKIALTLGEITLIVAIYGLNFPSKI